MKTPSSRTPTRSPGKIRLALLGGSFDPIHLGHLELAQRAIATDRFDQLWVSPTPQNPLKEKPLLPTELRWDCVREAVATLGDPRILASDRELRAPWPYTIDAARALVGEGFALTIVCGSDTFRGLARWREPRALVELVEWLVVEREAPSGGLAATVAGELGVSETELAPHVHPLAFVPRPISSTALRTAIRRFAASGETDARLDNLPAPVWRRIQANLGPIRKEIDPV